MEANILEDPWCYSSGGAWCSFCSFFKVPGVESFFQLGERVKLGARLCVAVHRVWFTGGR